MENICWHYIGNIKGEKGDVGKGLRILDYRTTADELPTEASAGDAYGVGNGEPYDIYIYSLTKGWVNNGRLQGAKGDKGDKGDTGEQGVQGEKGDKGDKGEDGTSAKITGATATVDETSGTPSVNVTMGGTESARSLNFNFSGLKGEKGDKGDKGEKGDLPLEHLNDTTKHITSAERVEWNGKAPGRHGLGGKSEPYYDDFLNMIHKGSGYYTVGNATDSPTGNGNWLNLFQLSKDYDATEGKETGAQIVADCLPANGTQGEFWVRTLMSGVAQKWARLIHSENIESQHIARIEVKTYNGNGLYGFENARTFTFSFTPKIFYISGYGRGGGNYTLTVPYGFPFAHTVVHTTDGGFAAMNCEFQYNANSITMYNTTSANNGFNTDGKPYTIIAIG